MRSILVGFILQLSILCFALEAGPYRIVGNVISFSSEFITLDTGDAIVEIPRNFVKKPLVSGKKLSLLLLENQKEKLNIKPKKK